MKSDLKTEARNPKAKRWTAQLISVFALVLAASSAFAQPIRIPGPQDYDRFSTFITDRNIFNPDRQAHSGYRRRPNRPRYTPGIQFVGTMSYDKGMFAFFSGNSSDQDESKVLQVGGDIVGYKVTALCATNVVLESTNKVQLSLAVGDGLKQENGKWISAEAADLAASSSAPETTASSDHERSSSEPAAAPPSTSEPNDILKRLMEQREKENQ